MNKSPFGIDAIIHEKIYLLHPMKESSSCYKCEIDLYQGAQGWGPVKEGPLYCPVCGKEEATQINCEIS